MRVWACSIFAGPSPANGEGMWPLPQNSGTKQRGARRRAARRKVEVARLLLIVLLAAGATMPGCAAGGTGTVAPPPAPPPPAITVSVTPSNSSVLLGNTQTFAATVANASNVSVTWSVNGVAGGNNATGTISATGVYIAPADLPTPATVQIAATSNADTSKAGSASVTVVSDVSMAIVPNAANVELGATQGFQAAITSSGHPDTSVHWTLTGTTCPSACGTVDINGNYTAPQILPNLATATLTAQSIADLSKQASASVTISSNFSLQVAAPGRVPLSGTATITATLTEVTGSSPNTTLSWSLSGPGCSGAACGVLNVVTTQASGSNPLTSSATYTAPSVVPSPDSVTVTVTPVADPSKKAQATFAVQSGVGVSLSPGTTTLAANHRVTLTAQVFGAANTGVTWSVNGIGGGNASVGQICVVGSGACQAVTNTNSLQVAYLAPGAIPTPNPVMVQATSVADTTKSATAQVTVINHVVVSVMPNTVTLAPLAAQTFTATVLGTSNQSVVWQVQGAACTTAGACGVVNATGTYTAPNAVPSPNTLQVVAVSADDSSQSGSANVTVSGGAQILALHPASVYAGAANGFTLRVDGGNFVGTSPGPGSALMIGGTARTTTCNTTTECTAPVTAADVAAAGNVSVQMHNPDGSNSNTVSLVVVAPNATDEVSALSTAAPAATGKDIVVVEPTTAGVSTLGSDVDLNVAALGVFDTVSNSCSLGGNSVALVRPSSGTTTTDICIFSQGGLDTSMAYVVTGTGDVTVISKQPAGLGIIHLTLQISASASPGARTLFIQNTNLDKTAASGALEVQ